MIISDTVGGKRETRKSKEDKEKDITRRQVWAQGRNWNHERTARVTRRLIPGSFNNRGGHDHKYHDQSEKSGRAEPV